MIYNLVKNSFEDCVKETLKELPTDTVQAVLCHEKKDLLINRLTEQIQKAELKGKFCDQKAIEDVIKEFVALFCKIAIQSADLQSKREYHKWLDQFKKLEEEVDDLEEEGIIKTYTETLNDDGSKGSDK